jgi:hypothetical protein
MAHLKFLIDATILGEWLDVSLCCFAPPSNPPHPAMSRHFPPLGLLCTQLPLGDR